MVGFKNVLNSYVLRMKIPADSCLKALGERLDQVDIVSLGCILTIMSSLEIY